MSMNYAEAIYRRSLVLPEMAAREALDFIEFLAQRYASAPQPVAFDDDARRQAALDHLASCDVRWAGKPIDDRDALHDSARS